MNEVKMSNHTIRRGRHIVIWRYTMILLAVWTASVSASLFWSRLQLKQYNEVEARINARVAYEKDIIYRRWNAINKGVYVQVTEDIQPNPYLSHIPERDITTPSGKKLTLMNPAYMTRKVHELAEKEFGIRGHITSLNPIRPQNAPDQWEIEALKSFRDGHTEVSSIVVIDNKEYMRLMRPLITEQSCLECHAAQGYKEGDILGGISVSVPLEPIIILSHKKLLTYVYFHALLWLTGIVSIVVMAFKLNGNQKNLIQIENELRTSEKKFRTLVENINIGIYRSTVGEKGEFIEVNPAAVKMFGYNSKNEMLNINVSDTYQNPDDRGEFDRKILKEGLVKGGELNLKKKDGTPFVGYDTSVAVKNEYGKIIYYDGIIEDITERKKAEIALQQKTAELKLIYSSLPVGLCLVSEDLRYLHINEFLAEQHGKSIEEHIGRAIREVIPKEQADDAIPHYQKVFRTGKPILDIESCVCYPGKPGEKRYWLDNYYPVNLPGGKRGAGIIVTEITERKKAEEALKESEERFRLIFENAGDGILIADADTKKFISANKKMLDMLGYSLEEIKGLGVADIHPEEDLPEVFKTLQKQLKGEIIVAENLPVLKKDGTVFYADIGSKLVVLNGEECFVGLFRDITDRKKLEEEKMHRCRLEAIHEMVVTLNHEMNQPLSVICSNVDILLSELEKDSRQHEDLEIVKEEAWKLAGLVKKAQSLREVKTTEYSPGTQMIDLDELK